MATRRVPGRGGCVQQLCPASPSRSPRRDATREPRARARAQQTESPFEKSPAIEKAIRDTAGRCLTRTDLRGHKQQGKVRDVYELDDHFVIVTTDRQSAFDRHLASIPFKGQAVNQTSAWWMAETHGMVENALVSSPHPNISIMKRCQVFPVEFVVRGYLTGSTKTSIWTKYSQGAREYCGNVLADGMSKNERLPANIITPTTKADTGDVPISPCEIVQQGLMTSAQWEETSAKALALFAFGQQQAASRGLLLVDTKYEFGTDQEGNVLLIDEVHTPDSSRYWLAGSYKERARASQEPDSIDKEFLRLWFREHCDPYTDERLPEAPDELVFELSRRYITLYEMITGQDFLPVEPEDCTDEALTAAIGAALK